MLKKGNLVLYEDLSLDRSRKMSALLVVKESEVEVVLEGMRTLMLQVKPNGGFRKSHFA